MKKMKGITWAHSRGFTSIVAVSQRYSELHPDSRNCHGKKDLYRNLQMHQLKNWRKHMIF